MQTDLICDFRTIKNVKNLVPWINCFHVLAHWIIPSWVINPINSELYLDKFIFTCLPKKNYTSIEPNNLAQCESQHTPCNHTKLKNGNNQRRDWILDLSRVGGYNELTSAWVQVIGLVVLIWVTNLKPSWTT